MLLKNKTIAIIGGGPGGLTLARLLQLKGATVKVYERDENKNVRVQGATLDLHFESGLKALEAAGLLAAFKTNYRPGNDRYRVVDKSATIIYDDHLKESTGDFGDEHFRPEIDRGALRNILLNSLQPCTVVWDSHLVSLENIDKGWQITFQNGSSAMADIIIGADGANSKIRPFLTPIKALYSGVTYITGNIENSKKYAPKLHTLLKGGKISGMGDSKTTFISSKGNGSLDFYIGFKCAADWVSKSGIDFKIGQHVFEWFKKEYHDWDSIWLQLFEQKNTQFIPRPLYGMPLDQYWEAQPNITLLGDAAHLLPPNGEGVNMAMLDALELSEIFCSQKFTDVQLAIACYEKQMFARFKEKGNEAISINDWMFSPDGLNKMVNMFNQLPA